MKGIANAARRARQEPARLIVGAFLVAFGGFTLWIGKYLVPRLLYAIEDGTADEINKLLLAIAGLVGVFFLVWRTWIADQQKTIAQEELYTGLLVKAVEQLGATREAKTEDGKVKTVPNTEVRLGAIYALEKLAHDYLPLHWQIMEILCAYVRKNAGEPEPRSDEIRTILAKDENSWTESEKAILEARKLELKPPFVDVQAALTVIGRRSERQRDFERRKAAESDGAGDYRLDLSACHLASAKLSGLRFEGASFWRSCLEGAELRGAHLEGAWLGWAHLEGASLGRAHLESAFLVDAHLEGASLLEARLEGAWLSGAHLENASLYKAHLEGAWLIAAHLEGASLSEALLEGARLADAIGLTQEQLDQAFGDENTFLPDGLTRPAHWTKSGAGEGETPPAEPPT